MKIAFIVPYVPNRVRTRPYNLINQLACKGHDVDVFTVGTGNADLADAEAPKSKCRSVYYYVQPAWRSLANSAFAVPSSKPLQSVYSLQSDLVHHLSRVFGGKAGSPPKNRLKKMWTTTNQRNPGENPKNNGKGSLSSNQGHDVK